MNVSLLVGVEIGSEVERARQLQVGTREESTESSGPRHDAD